MTRVLMASTSTSFQILFIIALILVGASIYSSLALSSPHSQSMSKMHEQWMMKFKRTYKDGAKKLLRLQVFAENVKYIESFNEEEGRTFKMGINEFTDLTTEEFSVMYSGCAYEDGLHASKQSGHFKYENFTDVPTQWDWRKKGAVTPIKQQGRCGACWAFGVTATILIETKFLISLSEQEIVDCGKPGGCVAQKIPAAYKYMMDVGMGVEFNYPFTSDVTGKAGECKYINTVVYIGDYYFVLPNDENALLQAVANEPVATIVAVNVTDFRGYRSGIYDGGCIGKFNHAVTLIGYVIDDGGEMYWIVKNSWGMSWGENGFFRIKRGVNKCGIAAFAT